MYSKIVKDDGENRRGEGVPLPSYYYFFVDTPTILLFIFCGYPHHPIIYLLVSRDFLVIGFQPLTRDPFCSIKPSNSSFVFHSSLQATNQPRKQASNNPHGRSRECGVRDLLRTSDNSNRIGMLSPTMS